MFIELIRAIYLYVFAEKCREVMGVWESVASMKGFDGSLTPKFVDSCLTDDKRLNEGIVLHSMSFSIFPKAKEKPYFISISAMLANMALLYMCNENGPGHDNHYDYNVDGTHFTKKYNGT